MKKEISSSAKKLFSRTGLGWICISILRLVYDQENVMVPVLQFYARMWCAMLGCIPLLLQQQGKKMQQNIQPLLTALSRPFQKGSFHYK